MWGDIVIINNMPIQVSLSEILDELKSQLSANGIQLLGSVRDTPNNIMVSCPYHKNGQERRPSAGIKKSDGVFHCFTCGETHSLQEVISFCFGHTDDIVGGFGWNWLLKNFVTVDVEVRNDVPVDYSRNRVCVAESYVSEEELDKYRVYHKYMWKRKMTPEIVDLFDIGYDSESKCVTFPVRDKLGRCLFVARRSVVTKFFNYPSGVKKPVYGLYELGTLDNFPKEVIVCESMIDAITCWVYGKPAVALNGLGNDLQFQQLTSMPCRKLILATDNDDAGLKARSRIRKFVKGKLITEYVLPADRKDINDLSEDEFNSLEEVF